MTSEGGMRSERFLSGEREGEMEGKERGGRKRIWTGGGNFYEREGTF